MYYFVCTVLLLQGQGFGSSLKLPSQFARLSPQSRPRQASTRLSIDCTSTRAADTAGQQRMQNRQHPGPPPCLPASPPPHITAHHARPQPRMQREVERICEIVRQGHGLRSIPCDWVFPSTLPLPYTYPGCQPARAALGRSSAVLSLTLRCRALGPSSNTLSRSFETDKFTRLPKSNHGSSKCIYSSIRLVDPCLADVFDGIGNFQVINTNRRVPTARRISSRTEPAAQVLTIRSVRVLLAVPLVFAQHVQCKPGSMRLPYCPLRMDEACMKVLAESS